MARRIIVTKKKEEAAPPEPPPMRKLTPKQREVVSKLRSGWRIMHGRTGEAHYATGHSTFNFGEMLCRPGWDRGHPINGRVLDALLDRKLIEPVERHVDISSFEAIVRSQSEPRLAYQLTLQGKTIEL
ncbi:hypothetical protein Rctr197k_230 [Virus Rctr197k]|nr:hypothetical protein Rctr197k_230 [Virus Rctr197k]